MDCVQPLVVGETEFTMKNSNLTRHNGNLTMNNCNLTMNNSIFNIGISVMTKFPLQFEF